MRYFIEFSYFGKNYFGYQIQPYQISVQEVLEKALSTILRQPIKITGAGRTDTGVHAKKMFAHFDYDLLLSEKLVYQLNSFLPPDIAVRKIFEVDVETHARFDAIYRTYQYHIVLEKNPFLQNSSWQIWKKDLNLQQMNKACEILFEYQDFKSFSKVGGDNKTTFCKIYEAKWEQFGNELVFTISADRFLRNMVRAIVGTMVEIGSNRMQTNDLRSVIEAKDRNSAGLSAPAQGLFLVDIGYSFLDSALHD